MEPGRHRGWENESKCDDGSLEEGECMVLLGINVHYADDVEAPPHGPALSLSLPIRTDFACVRGPSWSKLSCTGNCRVEIEGDKDGIECMKVSR
jgi:hypothetical protein